MQGSGGGEGPPGQGGGYGAPPGPAGYDPSQQSQGSPPEHAGHAQQPQGYSQQPPHEQQAHVQPPAQGYPQQGDVQPPAHGYPQQSHVQPPAHGYPQQSHVQQGYSQQAPPAGGYGQPTYAPPTHAFGPVYGGQTPLVSGATCPQCNSPQLSSPSFTWWGGILGPKLFHHTICGACHFSFNRKTGKSNTTAIAIYFAVIFAIGIALVIVQATL